MHVYTILSPTFQLTSDRVYIKINIVSILATSWLKSEGSLVQRALTNLLAPKIITFLGFLRFFGQTKRFYINPNLNPNPNHNPEAIHNHNLNPGRALNNRIRVYLACHVTKTNFCPYSPRKHFTLSHRW